MPDNIFSDKSTRESLFKPHGNEIAKDCDCNNLLDKDRPAEYFLHVPLQYEEQFDEKVNLNLSITKFATNVWQRGKFLYFNKLYTLYTYIVSNCKGIQILSVVWLIKSFVYKLLEINESRRSYINLTMARKI